MGKKLIKNMFKKNLIIMAQQQHTADVHPDELCPPNKRYDLMDANKKVDLEHLWHTLKEDGSKYRLKFMLDKKELSLTLDDFRTIFHLPQENDNNHNSFVPPPSFFDMVPFYKQELGFKMELKTSSSFKTTGLLQPWQTLCKIFSKCLTTQLLWEGLYYFLHHPTSSISFPRFTKIIVSHYMTIFPDISRRARDKYHNLKDDDIMRNMFNSERHKDRVRMQIPAWMISEDMKHTENYQMYAEVFGIDVSLTHSHPTESTQGTHRTPSTPRRSTRLTPPAPLPTVDKAYEIILQDTLQVSLAEHKIREEQEARENVAPVDEHLASEEIEKMVEEQENVIDDNSIPRNDEPNIPSTRIEPRSDKESPKVEITKVVIPVNVNDEDEERTDEVYELKRREKGKSLEESRNSPIPTPIRSPRIHTDLIYSDTEKLQELKETDTKTTPSSSSTNTKLSIMNRLLSLFKTKPARFKRHLHDVMVESLPTMVDSYVKEQVKKQVPEQVRDQVLVYMSGHILHVHPAQSQASSVPDQQYQLYLAMKADPQLTSVVRPRDQDDPHDDTHPEGENSAKRQKTSEYRAYVSGESSSGQVYQEEQAPSTS
ncbi:hypothetical protein Tco_1325699, partial [Tanacetum coccineum]